MKKQQALEEREAGLWGDEAKIAIEIAEWFELLGKFRQLADVVYELEALEATKPDAVALRADARAEGVRYLLEQLRRMNPERLDFAFHWLIRFFFDRFTGEGDSIAKSRQSLEGIKQRWSANSNAVVYTSAISASKAKMAVGGTRTECIDAALFRHYRKIAVKPDQKKHMTRILRENNALPAARKKR